MSFIVKILILAIVAVSAALGGWYTLNQNNVENSSENVQNTEDVGEVNQTDQRSSTNEVIQTEEGPRSLRALMLLGSSIQCDYEYQTEAGGVIVGTVYVDDGRVRGDFDMEQSGEVYTSHMIIKNDVMHTWTITSQGTFGSTFAIPEDGEDATASSDETVSLDQEIAYECSSWNVDESKFVIPTDIEFTDMSLLMNPPTTQAGGEGSQGQQCGLCDMATDATAKAQCRAAMGC